MRKKKNNNNSLANSRIFGSKGQLLFDTVLISGEDQIFYYSCIGFLLSFGIKGQNWKSILYIYENWSAYQMRIWSHKDWFISTCTALPKVHDVPDPLGAHSVSQNSVAFQG